MKTSELDYNLPQELIAKEPVEPRDAAKLLVVNKDTEKLVESNFASLADFLKAGDLLVFNETKVFPARVLGKKENGGDVEVLFLSETEPKIWEVLVRGRVRDGQKISLPDGLTLKVVKKSNQSVFVGIEETKEEVYSYLNQFGSIPLPPYIKRGATKADIKDYQTVFAHKLGSAAAPTASLHFTKELLKKLRDKGVETGFITLHVGLGTFAPVKAENLEEHPIHSEYYEIPRETVNQIKTAKSEGRRVIAVGTTVVRTLETLGQTGLQAGSGNTDIFIYPGFKFKVIDGLITNFHTPKSSLLGLVFAFLGKEKTLKAYNFAIKKRYRFFSYGDGMIIY